VLAAHEQLRGTLGDQALVTSSDAAVSDVFSDEVAREIDRFLRGVRKTLHAPRPRERPSPVVPQDRQRAPSVHWRAGSGHCACQTRGHHGAAQRRVRANAEMKEAANCGGPGQLSRGLSQLLGYAFN
jgi:hypothetical protein